MKVASFATARPEASLTFQTVTDRQGCKLLLLRAAAAAAEVVVEDVVEDVAADVEDVEEEEAAEGVTVLAEGSRQVVVPTLWMMILMKTISLPTSTWMPW